MARRFPLETTAQIRRCPTGDAPTIAAVRLMFFTYLFVIAAGITYFSAIGLTHH